MSKHRTLKDFCKLLELHAAKIQKLQCEKGSLEHWDILSVLAQSDSPIALRYSYVLGGMLGSERDQYDLMLKRLRAKGQVSVARDLEERRDKPCIDIQESIWMLNAHSKRDRGKSYGYSDYDTYADRQFIAGSATSFQIDWDLLQTAGSAAKAVESGHESRGNSLRSEAKSQASGPDHHDESTDSLISGGLNFASFDMTLFKALVDRFKGELVLKPAGWWRSASGEQLWEEFCSQILVAQATRSGQETVYRNSSAWSRVQLPKLLEVKSTAQVGELRRFLEKEFSSNGMRMASKKADYTTAALCNQKIVSECGKFVLIDGIANLWDNGHNEAEKYQSEIKARNEVKRVVHGFADKSASDFLLEIGFAERLVALDVRLTKVLRSLGLPWAKSELIQSDKQLYQKVQNFLYYRACPEAGITPRVLDRIFYQKNSQIMAGLTSGSLKR